MTNLKTILLALFTVALMASAVAYTQEKGDGLGIRILTQTAVTSSIAPEPVKLPSGRIGMVVSAQESGDPEGPNGPTGPNDPGPCVCTGYLWDYHTGTSFWTTYTTPGCFPNPILGCQDCCFRVLDNIGYDPSL